MLQKIISNKLGLILGFAIACLWLSYSIFPIKDWNKFYNIYVSGGSFAFALAVVIGFMISGYIVEHCITTKCKKTEQTWGTIVGYILISPV